MKSFPKSCVKGGRRKAIIEIGHQLIPRRPGLRYEVSAKKKRRNRNAQRDGSTRGTRANGTSINSSGLEERGGYNETGEKV